MNCFLNSVLNFPLILPAMFNPKYMFASSLYAQNIIMHYRHVPVTYNQQKAKESLQKLAPNFSAPIAHFLAVAFIPISNALRFKSMSFFLSLKLIFMASLRLSGKIGRSGTAPTAAPRIATLAVKTLPA